MKFIFTVLFILFSHLSSVSAIQQVENFKDKNCSTGNVEAMPVYDCGGFLSSDEAEDTDPLEPLNRGIFWFNQGIDYILIEPIAAAYTEIVPEFARIRIGYILRNLNEPIVFVNNLLQGELEDARDTAWRFVFNSTAGVAGIFDVSTDLELPYKKEDLGLTFASWGVGAGPYLIIPILGPSNARDAWGRIGDFTIDPINWVTFGLESTCKSAAQILDAKTDNISITDDIKKNAIDYYASIRSWYAERRESLIAKKVKTEDRVSLESPHPDEDD